jgi:hypothetical protein
MSELALPAELPMLPPELGVPAPGVFPVALEPEPPEVDPPGCVADGELPEVDPPGCAADGELLLPEPVEGELPELVWASAGATIAPTIPVAATSAIHRDAMFLCLLGARCSLMIRSLLG